MDKKFKLYHIEAPTFAERKMSFVISTAGVDRDHDTIDPKGWQLSNYLKNPVVMWAHDYSALPVAKATRIEQTDKGLSADIEFPPFGTYKFADTVHDMLKAGFLSATSVGFQPKKMEKNEERTRESGSPWGAFDIKEQELLEFSIVPVPSNPEALVTQRHAGTDPAIVKAWCKDITEWAAKQFDDAPARQGVEFYLTTQPGWKDFAKDFAVEMEDAVVPFPRLLKLLQLHKLIPTETSAQPDSKELAKQVVAHLPELIFKNGGVTGKTDDDIEIVQGELEDIEIISTEKEGHIEIDDAELTRVLRACVQETVAEVLGGEVRTALNRLRGRVD